MREHFVFVESNRLLSFWEQVRNCNLRMHVQCCQCSRQTKCSTSKVLSFAICSDNHTSEFYTWPAAAIWQLHSKDNSNPQDWAARAFRLPVGRQSCMAVIEDLRSTAGFLPVMSTSFKILLLKDFSPWEKKSAGMNGTRDASDRVSAWVSDSRRVSHKSRVWSDWPMQFGALKMGWTSVG